MKRKIICLLFSFVILITAGCATQSGIETPKYTILGGPEKGTFIVFAKEISKLACKEKINIRHKSSKGSSENVRRVNAHKDDFAIAYASHIFQARNGLLKNDAYKYNDISVLGYLYGYPAHLIFRKDLNIESATELIGSKVAVGPPASGSFYQCQVFFIELGIWHKIFRQAMSHNSAADYLIKNKIDAFWTMSVYPDKAVSRVFKKSGAKLIDLDSDGQAIGFFDKYPYFAKTVIPANTYPGIYKDIPTFQDSALLIAHKNVPDDVVKELLQIIYSEKGIWSLKKKREEAKSMKDNNGVYGISTPLHQGASQYYRETGLQ